MKKMSKEASNIKGLSRTVYNGYQPVEDKSIDWSKLPTSGSNAVQANRLASCQKFQRRHTACFDCNFFEQHYGEPSEYSFTCDNDDLDNKLTPVVSVKYNPISRIIELEQELAFKNGQINELRAAVNREVALNKELNEKLVAAYEMICKLRD